jgi:hypothetical protein
MKAELVFNLDEIGVSEWEDRNDKKVIIPRVLSGQMIYHRASRNLKLISAITCMSAAGESPTPYIVTSQDSESLRRKLMIRGVRLDVDLALRRQSKSYVNAFLFLEYVNKIFIPYLNELRESEQMNACEAVLLMDNCSPHVSDNVIAVLTNARVRVITFAPHTTHVFHTLNVVLFGALETRASGLEMWNEESRTVAFIIKLYHDFKQTMVEVNIWGTFSAIEFCYDITQNPYGLLFDEEKFRQSRAFLGLWARDTPLESLSTRRGQANFGWINKPESISLIKEPCYFVDCKRRYATDRSSRKVGILPHLTSILSTSNVFRYWHWHPHRVEIEHISFCQRHLKQN